MGDQTRKVWVAFTNTDLTEGRGYQNPLAVCEIEATAVRLAKGKYVQGSDCPVRGVDLIMVDGKWFAPIEVVNIQSASEQDLAVQVLADRRRMAIEKARAAGLSEDDIKAMQGLLTVKEIRR